MVASQVILPESCGKSAYARRQYKLRCRRRPGLEAVIGHLKSEHRLGRNYLQGILGDRLNRLLVAIGFNLSLLLRELYSPYSLCYTVPKVLGISPRKFVILGTIESY